jgi:hypothetical protein
MRPPPCSCSGRAPGEQDNPLALLELPAALQEHPATTDAGSPLPAVLSRRLQATFAARVQPLPPQTRHLLLAAVLDGTGDLAILDAVVGSPAADALLRRNGPGSSVSTTAAAASRFGIH